VPARNVALGFYGECSHIPIILSIRGYDPPPECLRPPIVAHRSVMSYDLKLQIKFCVWIGVAIRSYKHNKFGISESEWVRASFLT
jgi:hypothetical protein